jgi:hypothetical protein
MEPEGSLPYSQEPGTGPCPEADKVRYKGVDRFKMHFNIVLPILTEVDLSWRNRKQTSRNTDVLQLLLRLLVITYMDRCTKGEHKNQFNLFTC